jgi:hypothetical protein
MIGPVGMLVLLVITLAADARPTFVAQTLDQLPAVHGV